MKHKSLGTGLRGDAGTNRIQSGSYRVGPMSIKELVAVAGFNTETQTFELLPDVPAWTVNSSASQD